MAKSAAPAVGVLTAPCQFSNFVEESCFNKEDQLKQERGTVVFRLFSVGRALGPKIDLNFTSDYAVYYDGDDEYLMQQLELAAPSVNWRVNKVYHRWIDQSRIQILSADTGRIVAQVETRRYEGRTVKTQAIEAGQYGPNVVTLNMLRAARAAALAEQESEK